jgi:HEAT repeat protein
LEYYAERLSDSDESTRKKAQAALADALNGPHSVFAVFVLLRADPTNEKAAERLFELLEGVEGSYRTDLELPLGWVKPRNVTTFNKLWTLASDRNAGIRGAASKALIRSDKAFWPEMRDLSKSADELVKNVAIEFIGFHKIADLEATRILITGIHDHHISIRRRSFHVLLEMYPEDKEIADLLIGYLNREEDMQWLMSSIRMIGKLGKRAKYFIAYLKQQTKHPMYGIAESACWALEQIESGRQ